ncbi:unnamed protein product [Urochloa decumbens]|uniref:Protein kinase domain-containing protein n=1 Tax=Urochloa decumbens TaxID=240449 RepID=A0ABC8ZNM9_9POAL
MLLLALLASPAAAVNTSTPCATASCGNLTVPARNTWNPCAAALCGNINIAYPFWLGGTHPPECGYNAFEVTCDKQLGKVSLANSFLTYQILDIFYPDNSFRITNVGPMLLNDSCAFDMLFNVSSDLRLSPFKVSLKNQELFLYDCDLRETQTPRSWTRVPCLPTPENNSSVFALLGKKYTPDGVGMPPPMNCNESMIPVLGYDEGATGADYQRLIKGGFLLEYTDNGACKACTESGGQCRTNVTEDVFECHCYEGVHSATCGSKRGEMKIIRIVLMASAASLLFPCIYVMVCHRKGQMLRLLLGKNTISSTERNIEALIVSYGSLAPKRYKYSEVIKITSSLNNKLGEGGYGVVYKGRLHDGRPVAVKFLHDCKGNGEEFVNEVMSIGRTSHVNIVSLYGFCLERSKWVLIYEYMPNGSLDRYIYSDNPKEMLGWQKLYLIAIGIARGLEYLHHSCNTRIVHFDIKPQNILLDQGFCPKVADFGLAKLCHAKESKLSMTGARGTIGFIAPEVHSRAFGVVSTKSDVYSYGMMLLEMVGGRKNVKSVVEKSSQKYFPDWIYDHFALDDGLEACEVTCEVEEIAKKMTLIGLWCVQVLPMRRPTITKVLEMFERGLDELNMPPKQNFNQIPEDVVYTFNTESTSFSSHTKTQAFSEVVKTKKISAANSKSLKRLPTL